MKVIKKSENKVKARHLIDEFLTRCQEGGQWPTDLYQELCSDKDVNGKKTFDQFRDELLNETNGLCCYCMRKLSITNTTLEHVIPNKLETEDEYNKYQHYYSKNEWTKMIFSKSFLQQPYWPQSSYPHTIAYENLVPSCDGKMADLRTSDEKAKHIGDSRNSKCCNIKRGNDFVPPFIFSESMCKEFFCVLQLLQNQPKEIPFINSKILNIGIYLKNTIFLKTNQFLQYEKIYNFYFKFLHIRFLCSQCN